MRSGPAFTPCFFCYDHTSPPPLPTYSPPQSGYLGHFPFLTQFCFWPSTCITLAFPPPGMFFLLISTRLAPACLWDLPGESCRDDSPSSCKSSCSPFQGMGFVSYPHPIPSVVREAQVAKFLPKRWKQRWQVPLSDWSLKEQVCLFHFLPLCLIQNRILRP